ncbi:DNA translocase FtsK [Levilactobacillus cerevisiae]|uniref:DNA translocase FtsK n=1 Tax=Levilactobacillus cerevisiae TaxID=1704076 RepID=UPI00345ECAA7
MEHYDGPAFYRKFPVEPTPEELEDTTDERAQRQVRLRKERNDRLRLREQREQQRADAAQSAAQEVLHQTKPVKSAHPQSVAPATNVAKTPEQAAAAASANYRPFAITPLPKQRTRKWQPSVVRRRYQRLLASFPNKTKDDFFLFGRAEEETVAEPAPKAVTVDDTPIAPTVVFTPQPQDVHFDVATGSGTSDVEESASGNADTAAPETVARETEAFEPTTPEMGADSRAATTHVDPIDSESTDSVRDETEELETEQETAMSSAELTAPTEIFYPENTEPTATSEAYLPVDNQPEATQATTATAFLGGETADTEASVAEPEVSELETIESETSDTEDIESETTKPGTKDSEDTDSADAESNTSEADSVSNESTSTVPIAQDEAADSEAATSNLTETPTAVADAETEAGQPAEVTELLHRAMSPEPSATFDDTDSAADVVEPDSAATAKPVVPVAQTPSKPAKAKPARGLGHSLGDIMQEEGNDQRNLALFDRPTTATVATAAPDAAPEEPARGYHFPDLALLPSPVVPDEEALDEWIEHQAEVLDATLSAFHVDAHVSDWTVGPTVTQFQISLALGVKVNKITNLNDDLKLALAAKDIRIEAPIPGKSTVGIEIPNLKSRPVMLSEILNSAAFKNSESPLTVALGVDLFGKPQVTDLRKMPHGLIAGATGSGKSVFINSLLLSILYKATPQQVKLLLIDPKAVEMAPYDALPHLLSPVISDPKAAAAALKWVVTEMDERYEKLAAAGVRNIEQFNDRADANDEPSLKMPYIVIIIDELADLMMMAASEVQDYIVRITQKARAAGIHLLVATQRPSVDIVTGTIKNNIPTRIAFMVSSQIDSRTILDTAGAENLLGRGDMLYLGNGASQPMRLQGAFVESEVDGVTDFVRTQGQPHYAFEPKGLLQRETAEENQDELLPKVLEYIAQEKSVSTSKLQRVFSIGYNRAANLIDDLEQNHYVSPQHGSKPREVYLTPEDLGKDLPEPHDQGAPFSS